MNRAEYLLTQAASECMEVAHRITKALHFGLNEIEPGKWQTNAQRIAGEFIELLAVMDMLHKESLIGLPDEDDWMLEKEKKIERVEHYLAYAIRECGTVTSGEPS